MSNLFQKNTESFFSKFGPRFVDVFLAFCVCMAITALMVFYGDPLPSQIKTGMPAQQDVIAGQRYEWVEENATQNSRELAAKQVLPVYDYQKDLASIRNRVIAEVMDEARNKIRNSSILTAEDEQILREKFQITLGVVLTDAQYEILRKDGFSDEIEKTLLTLLDPLQRRMIVDDKLWISDNSVNGITLRTLFNSQVVKEDHLRSFNDLISRDEARLFYQDKKTTDLQKHYNLDFVELKKIKSALDVLPDFIKSNVTYNSEFTELLKNKARENVQPIKNVREKGEIIIRHGEKYEEWHIRVIEGIRKARLESNTILKFFSLLTVIGFLMMGVLFFADREILRLRLSRKDYYFLGTQLLGFVIMLRFGSFLATHLYDTVSNSSGMITFYYLFPVAAGTMLVRYILNAETSFVFAVLLSVLAGLFLDNSIEITVYYLVSSVMASHLIAQAERRSTVFRYGLYLAFLQCVIATAFCVMNKYSTGAMLDGRTLLTNGLFAFAGGILNAIVVLALSPMMESVFTYTTNFQLMELANMNHPLLREMIVRAPGTYHHSQLVGILAEAGAQAIQANSLLAKVASFYHDIGKMKKPQYFIENQKGYNPHDHLSPSMSALIIEAHVKEGIEMAKEAKLPKIISDFIPEHQGTKLIGYFYQKAKKLAEENDSSPVEEKDYRYPGPKPQSREAGIVMLADTIEAAVRSMPDKAPQKIEAQVKKHVDHHFTDGQLDECQLTLKDLNLIVDAFVKILVGIYHQRVEYPDHGDKDKKNQKADLQAENAQTEIANRVQASYANNIAPLFREKN